MNWFICDLYRIYKVWIGATGLLCRINGSNQPLTDLQCLTLLFLRGHSTITYSEALFHINANVDKTVYGLYKINRHIIGMSGFLIGRKTRVDRMFNWKVIHIDVYVRPLIFTTKLFQCQQWSFQCNLLVTKSIYIYFKMSLDVMCLSTLVFKGPLSIGFCIW